MSVCEMKSGVAIRARCEDRSSGLHQAALWPAHVRICTFIEAKRALGVLGDPDPHRHPDRANRLRRFAEPHIAAGKEIAIVLAVVDAKGLAELPWPAGQVDKARLVSAA